MKLRYKLILLAILPLCLALAAVALTVRGQADALSRQQRATVEAAWMNSKEDELRHYVTLATSAIAPLYDQAGGVDDDSRRAQALATLARLEYGRDGYFFVYDLHGNNLMHPRQPELVGRNLMNLRDPNGEPTIQRLIARARAGGGFVRYLWERPSTHQLAPKLGYVLKLERWGWMIGTGTYLDDVDGTLASVEQRAAGNIAHTLWLIVGIAIVCMVGITASGLALNISEYKTADARLRLLAQKVVQSQEQERARLSRELHDGISQLLVSGRLTVELAEARLEAGETREGVGRILRRAIASLNDTLGEVRRISQNLRPAMLDDLGLPAALDKLAADTSTPDLHVSARTEADADANARTLPEDVNTALYRVAQEALTNIQRHAGATTATLELHLARRRVLLMISDNGRGFDARAVQRSAAQGLGLSNMRERLDALGGRLDVRSRPGHSAFVAQVPLRDAGPSVNLNSPSEANHDA